jgi:hypothetical protein
MTPERLAEIRNANARWKRIIAQTGNFMGPDRDALVASISDLLSHLDAVTNERDAWKEAFEEVIAGIRDLRALIQKRFSDGAA